MMPAAINSAEKLARIDAPWSPRVVAELNDCISLKSMFKRVKIRGDFVWHRRPHAEAECHVLPIEPRATVDTGDASGAMTAADDIWT